LLVQTFKLITDAWACTITETYPTAKIVELVIDLFPNLLLYSREASDVYQH
jgi:hypothetical protein